MSPSAITPGGMFILLMTVVLMVALVSACEVHPAPRAWSWLPGLGI